MTLKGNDMDIHSIGRKIRDIKRELYLEKTQMYLLYSQEFKKFRSDKDRKMILIDTPEHGNLGDQAIVYAQHLFLQKECGIKKMYEFTYDEYCAASKMISLYVHDQDVLFVPGGGFIGTLWENEEKVLLNIIKQFHNNKVVVFPQTAYFEDSQYGSKEKEKFRSIVKDNKNLTVFARDWESYYLLSEIIGMDKNRCFYVPDIVTYLKYNNKVDKKRNVIFCLRQDKEKVLEEEKIQNFIHKIEAKGLDIVNVDTIVKGRVSKGTREYAIQKKLNEFASGYLVITDRLHGMLFAALVGTPCIALDNLSGKVSGVFQWIQYLEYVQCVGVDNLNIELLEKMLNMKENHYSNHELKNYFVKMRDIILQIIDKTEL